MPYLLTTLVWVDPYCDLSIVELPESKGTYWYKERSKFIFNSIEEAIDYFENYCDESYYAIYEKNNPYGKPLAYNHHIPCNIVYNDFIPIRK